MARLSRVAGLLAVLILTAYGSAQATPITGVMTDPLGKQVDTYLIHITNPLTFAAKTVNAGTTPGLDAMLFLYDTAGNPIEANDDTCGTSNAHRIRRPTLPAGSLYSPVTPGLYLLAISVFQNVPYDSSNTLLFVPVPAGQGVIGPNALAGALDLHAVVNLSRSDPDWQLPDRPRRRRSRPRAHDPPPVGGRSRGSRHAPPPPRRLAQSAGPRAAPPSSPCGSKPQGLGLSRARPEAQSPWLLVGHSNSTRAGLGRV